MRSYLPDLLLVVGDRVARDRWARVLGTDFLVRAASDLAGIRAFEADHQPDICVIDIEIANDAGQPLLVALRGIHAGAEFVAIGQAPRLDSLIASVNDGQIRRYLRLDSEDETIRDVIKRVWRDSRSMGLLRRRMNDIIGERDRLLEEQARLVELLAENDRQVSESTDAQRGLREKLEGALYPTSVRSAFPNCLPYPMLLARIREEVERYKRYGHGFALLQLDWTSVDDHTGDREQLQKRLESVIASKVRHIDLVASDPPARMLVLLPATERKKADIACRRVTSAIEEAGLPLDARVSAVLSYPEDKSRVLLIA